MASAFPFPKKITRGAKIDTAASVHEFCKIEQLSQKFLKEQIHK